MKRPVITFIVACLIGRASIGAQGRRPSQAARGPQAPSVAQGPGEIILIPLYSASFKIERRDNQQTTAPRMLYSASLLKLQTDPTRLWLEVCDAELRSDALSRSACRRPSNVGGARDVSIDVNQEFLNMWAQPVAGRYVLIWRDRGQPRAYSSDFLLTK